MEIWGGTYRDTWNNMEYLRPYGPKLSPWSKMVLPRQGPGGIQNGSSATTWHGGIFGSRVQSWYLHMGLDLCLDVLMDLHCDMPMDWYADMLMDEDLA